MHLNALAEIVREMDGMMPQPARTRLAQRILRAALNNIKEQNKDLFDKWIKGNGPNLFLEKCELKSPDPCVPSDLNVHATDLANFCNRWMAVDKFREKGGEYKPITAEMHQIRFTIIEELKGLHDGSDPS